MTKEKTTIDKSSIYWILQSVNTKNKLKDKQGFSYLSWSHAWAEVKKHFPDATYIVFENKKKDYLPIWGNPEMGYFVKVSVTIGDLTHESRLPVMDSKNKPMKNRGYSYQQYNKKTNKYDLKKVDAISVFEINKSVQRALVKACAMHGLGLNVWKGEDFPEVSLEKITKSIMDEISLNLESINDEMSLNDYWRELTEDYYVDENLTKLFRLKKEELQG